MTFSSAKSKRRPDADFVAFGSVERKCPYDWCLRVRVQHDEFDASGEKVDERNAEFMAWTMLEAIKCWDEGEPFVPDTLYP